MVFFSPKNNRRLIISKFEMFSNDSTREYNINHGDLFRWTGICGHHVCIYAYNGLISLQDPLRTWWNTESVEMNIIKSLKEGNLIKLPAGTKITLTQE